MKEDLLKYRPTQIKNNEIESVYENGKITIIYPKKFGKIEKWVKDRIGGLTKLEGLWISLQHSSGKIVTVKII